MAKNNETLKAINAVVEKLWRQLEVKRDQFRKIESSIGTGHDNRKLLRLSEEIERIEQRLARAERLQDRS